MDYDVVVVGAGPAGSQTARRLASQGLKVALLEEHHQIGRPVHCSGLVTPRTLDVAQVQKNLAIRIVNAALVSSESGKQVMLKSNDVRAVVIDREGLDLALAEKAQQAGAELMLGFHAHGVEQIKGGARVHLNHHRKGQSLDCRLVIGADGSRSVLSNPLGGHPSVSSVIAISGEAELASPVEDHVEVFVGAGLAPSWFAWIIPVEGHRARIGIGTTAGQENPRRLLSLALDRLERFKGAKVLRLQGGVIPLYYPRRIYGNSLLLVGDAAGQVKPTSGGGIYTSLLAANMAAKTALEAFKAGRWDAKFLSRYQKEWSRSHARELLKGRALFSIYSSLSQRDLDSIITVLSNPRLQHIISAYGDIDYPSRLLSRLLRLQLLFAFSVGAPPATVLKMFYQILRWRLLSLVY